MKKCMKSQIQTHTYILDQKVTKNQNEKRGGEQIV